MNHIEVTVAGKALTGKSSVARIIKESLGVLGVTVKLEDHNETCVVSGSFVETDMTPEHHIEALVKGGLSVIIRTVQLPRE